MLMEKWTLTVFRGIKNKTNESKRLIGFMEYDEFLYPNTEG